MRRRWRWLAGIAAVIAMLLIAGTVGYLHSHAFRKTLERKLESVVIRESGRDCRLRLVDFHPFALTAEIEDLWIAGASDDDPAFLELDEIRIDAGWRLLVQQRLALSELSVDGLRIHLDQLPTFPVDEPTSSAPPMTFEDLTRLLAIDRAAVSDGIVSWENKSVAVSFRAGGLSLSLERGDRRGDHRLRLEVARGTVDLPVIGAFPFAARGDAELAASGLKLTRPSWKELGSTCA